MGVWYDVQIILPANKTENTEKIQQWMEREGLQVRSLQSTDGEDLLCGKTILFFSGKGLIPGDLMEFLRDDLHWDENDCVQILAIDDHNSETNKLTLFDLLYVDYLVEFQWVQRR